MEPEILEEHDFSYRVYNPVKLLFFVSNTLEYTRISWKENFRQGIDASVSAGERCYIPYYADNWNQITASASFAAFSIFRESSNPSLRISAEYGSTRASLSMANRVRGIRDNDVTAEGAVYLNTGFQFKLFRFNTAEVHVNPVFDAALLFGMVTDKRTAIAPAAGIGVEIILFEDRMKSMPIKMGFAFGLYPINETLSKRFEIDLNFTFTY
jgi:hypothetical protein